MAAVAECIKKPVEQMSLEEVGILYLILIHGKGTSTILEQTNPEELRFWNTSYDQIATMMNEAFISGLGFVDALKDQDNNYGRQLEFVIQEVLIKAMEIPKPFFNHSPDSFQGALDRERWVVEKLKAKAGESMGEMTEERVGDMAGLGIGMILALPPFLLPEKQPRWRVFERHAEREIPHRYPEYKWRFQKVSKTTGKRVDAFGIRRDNPKDRMIIEFKDVRKLTKAHVNQPSREYRWPFFPTRKQIWVPKKTEVPQRVLEYAQQKGVEIEKIPRGDRRMEWLLWGTVFVTLAFVISTLAGYLNPREWDKYLPAVFIIGMKRLELEGQAGGPRD